MTFTPTGSRWIAVACALAVAAVLAPATGSQASARAADAVPDRVVVSGDDLSVVVTSRPFRLSFRDARGRTVLGHVPDAAGAPTLGGTSDLP